MRGLGKNLAGGVLKVNLLAAGGEITRASRYRLPLDAGIANRYVTSSKAEVMTRVGNSSGQPSVIQCNEIHNQSKFGTGAGAGQSG